MNSANSGPLRERLTRQAARIGRLQGQNRELRRAIADALELLVEALGQPHPTEPIEEARAILADAQPQADVRI